MILKPSSLAVLFRAIESLRSGRCVLVVAGTRTYAFQLARVLVALAKRLDVPLANHRSVTDASRPWVYARAHGDEIELLAKDCDVHADPSACFERQMLVPAKVRCVEV